MSYIWAQTADPWTSERVRKCKYWVTQKSFWSLVVQSILHHYSRKAVETLLFTKVVMLNIANRVISFRVRQNQVKILALSLNRPVPLICDSTSVSLSFVFEKNVHRNNSIYLLRLLSKLEKKCRAANKVSCTKSCTKNKSYL